MQAFGHRSQPLKGQCKTSEVECKEGNDLKLMGSTRKGGLVGRNENGVTDQVKDLHTWSSWHASVEISYCFATSLLVPSVAGVFYSVLKHQVQDKFTYFSIVILFVCSLVCNVCLG
ncbi:hypothetical protein VIGAN_03192800 [Vigna angularis var. angularis]|uniref:Uncharacterized protein n=1 Tax=Vigna angularis var. angularis TaxID=157739 RepID=A0A0S3RN41_PHAAN|nr:hypothetical protein VIGAN_03192800 [Vigna angularis var. angularis]